jgi:hypothetical protein
MGLWNEMQVASLRPINDLIKSQGAVPRFQLAQAGWDIMGPTDQAFDDDGVRLWKAPKCMQ